MSQTTDKKFAPTHLKALPSLKENLLNKVVEDLVHPMLHEEVIKYFQFRLWHGGDYCPGGDGRYLIFKANAEKFRQDIADVANVIRQIEFELELNPEGGVFTEDDAEMLSQADKINVYNTKGELVNPDDYELVVVNKHKAGYTLGYIDAKGEKLLRLTFNLKLRSHKEYREEKGTGEKELDSVSIYFTGDE